jgi:hypothetical protein
MKPAAEPLVTGTRFGRLTVIREAPSRREPSGSSYRMALCRCDCGTEREFRLAALRKGGSKSCGCLQREKARALAVSGNTTHGMSRTPIYRLWRAMLRRCNDPKNKRFDSYGGRGIKVCERWLDFSAFYADMGNRPHGMSLDRIDNDGNYEPSNCRWATPVQQSRNKRPFRKKGAITFAGKKMGLAWWARETGISSDTISRRLELGWSVERTLTTPLRRQRNNRLIGQLEER